MADDRDTDNYGEAEEDSWLWIAAAAGVALGAAGVMWWLRYRDPVRSMDRLLRRCQERIRTIESSLADLETAVSASAQ